jgi:hypothetical protein
MRLDSIDVEVASLPHQSSQVPYLTRMHPSKFQRYRQHCLLGFLGVSQVASAV